MSVIGSVNMKALAITRKSRIGRFDQDHIKRSNHGNSIKKRLHGKQQAVSVELCTVSVFIANRRGVIFSEINKLFAFGRLILKFFLSNERLRSQVRQMRIDASKANDKVIVRRRIRWIKRADEELKQRIIGKIIKPKFDRRILKMIHQDERTN